MKNVHLIIYETLGMTDEEVMEILGSGDIRTVVERRRLMRVFLSNNEWSISSYKAYIQSESKPLPTKATMTKNVAIAGKQAMLSGFKKVSDEEQQRRHDVCKAGCEFHRKEDDRCSKCGCFTAFKSALEAWHCPIDKW